jgi:predicted  nucleic acid-binding Zn ribbon protein
LNSGIFFLFKIQDAGDKMQMSNHAIKWETPRTFCRRTESCGYSKKDFPRKTLCQKEIDISHHGKRINLTEKEEVMPQGAEVTEKAGNSSDSEMSCKNCKEKLVGEFCHQKTC